MIIVVQKKIKEIEMITYLSTMYVYDIRIRHNKYNVHVCVYNHTYTHTVLNLDRKEE